MLFSKNINLFNHNVTDRQTDRQTGLVMTIPRFAVKCAMHFSAKRGNKTN